MKFAIVNTKTLGYRQTKLSPKKMNKMNALELFSLLPSCIINKITSNLSIGCCNYCKVTEICATDGDNRCSECKLMHTICLCEAEKPKKFHGYYPWTWQQQKKYMEKKIGFMKHHRYVTHDGNYPGLAYSNVPIVPVDPTQKTTLTGGDGTKYEICMKYTHHTICYSYIKIVKVLKTTIHYKMNTFYASKYTPKENIIKWLKDIERLQHELKIRKARVHYGWDTQTDDTVLGNNYGGDPGELGFSLNEIWTLCD